MAHRDSSALVREEQETAADMGEDNPETVSATNTLMLSEVVVMPIECIREIKGSVYTTGPLAGTFAQDTEGNYIAGEVWISCTMRLSARATYETTYSPGYIHCLSWVDEKHTSKNEVTGRGVAEIVIEGIPNFEKFQDLDLDYVPDGPPPGPEKGWDTPLECVLLDRADYEFSDTSEAFRCAPPGSSPDPYACGTGFAQDAALLDAHHEKIVPTPVPIPTPIPE